MLRLHCLTEVLMS